MAGQKNCKMRGYLFKRLDQQTTTTAHPQWAMGTHRSAPCPHLDGLVTDMDTLLFYEFPLSQAALAFVPRATSPAASEHTPGIRERIVAPRANAT